MVAESKPVSRPVSGPAPLSDLRMLWLGMAAVALVILAVVIRFGGAFSAAAVPELTQAGAFTKGGLSLTKLAMNAAGTVTVGWLLMTAVFLPDQDGKLSALGQRCLRGAAVSAIAWAMSALALIVFSISDLFGVPVATGISGNMLRTFLIELPQGRALLAVTAVAAVISIAAHLPRTAGGSGYLLVLAVAGLLPPIFTGHAAGSDDHALAVFSLAAHIAGAALWVGGLVVLVAMSRSTRGELPYIVPRYSVLALVCFVAVGASGLANAWVRLGGINLDSRYGTLIVGKTAALIGMGALGWWHRRRSIPSLRTERRTRVFLRIAAIELLAMAATMSLATGLSRTPPPEVPQGTLNAVTLRLGFPLPDSGSIQSYVLDWRIDALFLPLIVTGAVLYAAGVVRLRRNGTPWPLARTVAWFSGLAGLFAVTCGGLARFSMVLFSAHIVQHMALSMIVPILLVLGAPITLAMRALRSGPTAAGRTPRELILALLESRAARMFAHPLVAMALFIGSLYGFYFSSLFETSLRNHAVHSLAMAFFVFSGLCFWSGIGAPSGSRASARSSLLLLMVCHAFFGIAFISSGDVLAGDWFSGLGRTWGATPAQDQQTGGALAWTLGWIITLLALAYSRRQSGTPAESSLRERSSTPPIWPLPAMADAGALRGDSPRLSRTGPEAKAEKDA
ncbi:bifunctional copper resistance protein CopD/cytochrome c oxidase assembly protein [Actinomadura rudentiformis]|uniref:Bifunctional copper resistance protein CopD/cytochrome c oxidase assembly protein n=1 Tax=Actinomadura rudentiformis TaxID=359158 RepID=A0A6H9Y7N8_9ACTN|nr:bifunctional copper resistance protein CopD/cytochrome c oxidase assembly protein [Actinomadura rudentiformis]KAB2336980.1 bifunctional copper resistance protein CopD/cytochrome c oxidase assembly protein [Actinomadura rudentiformis]